MLQKVHANLYDLLIALSHAFYKFPCTVFMLIYTIIFANDLDFFV